MRTRADALNRTLAVCSRAATPRRFGLFLLRACAAPAAARTSRHLAAGAPRLRQPDGDRLLATRHLLARATAAQRAALALMHGALHFRLRLLSIPCHDHSLVSVTGANMHARACR